MFGLSMEVPFPGPALLHHTLNAERSIQAKDVATEAEPKPYPLPLPREWPVYNNK